ncbi:MAG: DUF6285 domain-containing protein [Alcanivoracaceae bacterium]
MRIQPDGANLLDTVATLLRDQILPDAPADQQYALRMAVNAIGIARRQLANGDRIEQQQRVRIARLLALGTSEDPERELARRVREGAARHNSDLQTMLWQVTEQRVRESAPRYLVQEPL